MMILAGFDPNWVSSCYLERVLCQSRIQHVCSEIHSKEKLQLDCGLIRHPQTNRYILIPCFEEVLLSTLLERLG